MKRKHIGLACLAAFALTACTSTPEEIRIGEDALNVKIGYGSVTEGVALPSSYFIAYDENLIETTATSLPLPGVADPGTYRISVYGASSNVTVDGQIARVATAGDGIESADWFFAWCGYKRMDYNVPNSMDIKMAQYTQQINLALRCMGEKSDDIASITAHLSGVAGSVDLESGIYADPSTVSAALRGGVLAGSYRGELRIIGAVTTQPNVLTLDVAFNDGSKHPIVLDLSDKLPAFNNDKTAIHEASINIGKLGEADETVATMWVNGTLENEGIENVAPEGELKLAMNWPGYNDASRIEINSGEYWYISELTLNGEGHAETVSGFAELPASIDALVEVAIYHNGERIVMPLRHATYENGTFSLNCIAVATAEHLAKVADNLAGNYVQTGHIALLPSFQPIGSTAAPFTGTFDGNGYELQSVSLNRPDQEYVAIFGYNEGTIRNVTVADGTIAGKKLVAGIVAENAGIVDGCVNHILIVGELQTAGIVGHAKPTSQILNCENRGDVDCPDNSAGICGFNEQGRIENCVNYGKISGAQTMAGITGNSNGEVVACSNKGMVDATGGWAAGGIVGYNGGGKIRACHNDATISSNGCQGGITGVNSWGEIVACYNIGAITSKGSTWAVGAFAGQNDNGTISHCYSTQSYDKFIGDGAGGDVKLFSKENWPTNDASTGWGVWTEGCTPQEGYWWKTLGSMEDNGAVTYPSLYWE